MMDWKRTCRAVGLLLLFVLLVAYLVYAVIHFRGGNPDEVCTSVVINTRGGEDFMDSGDVADLLRQADLYPQGLHMTDIRTRDIEQTLLQHGMISRASCYKAANPTNVNEGTVCIDVTLRQPILHVLPGTGTPPYWVDDDGIIIPDVPHTQNILTATGDVTPTLATGPLSDLALFISEDPYWDSLITQIHVEQDRRQRHIVRLIPRLGNQTILLGPPDNYEKKLRRMRIFYQQAVPKIGWERYTLYNLEFANQIICTRK